jgi:hypothetical protein
MSKVVQICPERDKAKKIRASLTKVFRTSYIAEFGLLPTSADFRALTNSTYQIVLGADADTLRARLGATERESLRDILSSKELSLITEAESLLIDRLTAGYPIQKCLEALWQAKNSRD